MSFTCPKCGKTSHNPNDEREGYCGACHDWTGRINLESGDKALFKRFASRLYVLSRRGGLTEEEILAIGWMTGMASKAVQLGEVQP